MRDRINQHVHAFFAPAMVSAAALAAVAWHVPIAPLIQLGVSALCGAVGLGFSLRHKPKTAL